MKFAAKASGDFEVAPAGNHVAICISVVDLGLQPGKGMYPDPKHEVYIGFELPAEIVTYEKDGQQITGPMSIGRRFTASMSEKANLRKFIEGWFSKKFPSDEAAADFELKNLLGRKCLLNISHTEKNGKTYANASGAGPIPKGMQAEYPQHNPSLYYSLDDPNPKEFDALKKWMKDTLSKRIREQPQTVAADSGEPFDDDIPF